MKRKTTKIGSFALCNNNQLGLILYEKKCVDKRSKKIYTLYHGICLSPPKKYGNNWQSKNPKFLNKNQFVKLWKEKESERVHHTVKESGLVQAALKFNLIKNKDIAKIIAEKNKT